MLIRNQDRTCVCNTGKMEGISMAEKSDGTAFLTMRFSGYPRDNCALGTYKTKERAMEVLTWICKDYQYLSECSARWEVAAKQPGFVFDMPEE